MSKNNSIIKNILSNVGGYIVTVFVAFLIAPITIHGLGDTRYGAWSLVSELIGYYGLLDLGIRGAVMYHVAKYSATNQQKEIKVTLSSAFWLLSLCGFLAFLVGIGFTIGFPYLFKIDGFDLVEVQQALLIMSGLIALSLPMNTFGGALTGKQRFDISSGVEVANRILTAVLVYIVMKRGGGLVALSFVQAVGRIVSWSLTLFACRKILGGIFIRPNWFKREMVRTLMAYGYRNALGQIALMVIYRMDLVVVGMFAGIDRVIFYSLASTLVSYAWTLCSNIVNVFTPRFAHLNSNHSSIELQELYFSGLRMTGMVVTGLVSGLLVFGKDFIRLWVGVSYVSGPWTDRSDIIMYVLILANFPRMLQSISWQRLYGIGRVSFLMWLNIGEASSNLILSILFACHFGPIGVAFGTFFPLFVSHIFIMPIYSCRVFKISPMLLLRKGFSIPLVTGLLMACINMACVFFMPPSTWLTFVCDVIIAGISSTLLCFAIGLTRKEQRDFLGRLVSAIESVRIM